jgi:hypothetical protein
MRTLALVAAFLAGASAQAGTLRKKTKEQRHLGKEYDHESGAHVPILWTNSGGGWRAMVSAMGTAKLLDKIGVLKDVAAIGSSSGASWFALQFFYSQQFHDKVLGGTDADLNDFVQSWMQAYNNIWPPTDDPPQPSPFCQSLDPYLPLLSSIDPALESLFANCAQIESVVNNWSWASGMDTMLQTVSTDYGDPSLATRQLSNNEHKIASLKYVDLHVQTTFTPNAIDDTGSQVTSFGGPSTLADQNKNNESTVFDVSLPMQYTISSQNTGGYNHWLPDDFFRDLDSYRGNKREEYAPASLSGNVTTSASGLEVVEQCPLQNNNAWEDPNVLQLFSATSARFGAFMPSSPTMFNQLWAPIYQALAQSGSDDADSASSSLVDFLNLLWDNSQLGATGVCTDFDGTSNTFSDCGVGSGRFIDSGYSDGTSLAQTLGAAQIKQKMNQELLANVTTPANIKTANLDASAEPIKIIHAYNDFVNNTNTIFLLFWDTDANEGIAPGNFLYSPDVGVAIPSKQIFNETLQESDMQQQLTPMIANTTLQTATFRGTTIDNPAYGVAAGTPVDILFVRLNSPIPTYLLTRAGVEPAIQPLGDMAEMIASSDELGDIIKAFADA